MLKQILVKTMITAFVLTLLGCRFNYLQNYTSSSQSKRSGIFIIELNGTVKDESVGNKKIRSIKEPYSLSILFKTSNHSINRIQLIKTKLISNDGDISFESSSKSNIILGENLEGEFITGITFSNLMIPYKDYVFISEFTIFDKNGEEIESDKIKTDLKREYSESKTNDIIDTIMGI